MSELMDLHDDIFYDSKITDILDFQYVAYGNAQMEHGKIVCQHGPAECVGNAAETCAKNMTGNDPVQYLPFHRCVEEARPIDTAAVRGCAAQHGLDGEKLMQCADGPVGAALLAVEADLTAQAKVATGSRGVPFYTYNGARYFGEAMDIPGKACDDWVAQGFRKPYYCPLFTKDRQ
eukprot:TRINITY_DN5542_c0_g4_i1.p2 TRINITY_DN5542_c0_g4~~TRINITY_DN5542_c0_g4_i1.p2  ORF type:complete len:176 (+),score=55.66 TRINITY_DN5542_c0_g4_i1:163-690(+)